RRNAIGRGSTVQAGPSRMSTSVRASVPAVIAFGLLSQGTPAASRRTSFSLGFRRSFALGKRRSLCFRSLRSRTIRGRFSMLRLGLRLRLWKRRLTYVRLRLLMLIIVGSPLGGRALAERTLGRII